MIQRLFICSIVLLKSVISSLTREELTSLRNSVRVVTVELHTLASVLDNVLRRSGGPVQGSARELEERNLSDHLSHPAMENLFRSGSFIPPDLKEAVFGSGKSRDASALAFVMPMISSGLSFALSVVCFLYDMLLFSIFQVSISKPSARTKVYKPHPGRYYSPIPTFSDSDSERLTPRVFGLSLLLAVVLQSLLATNIFPLTVSIYTVRLLSLIPLFHTFKHASSSNSGMSPTHVPPTFGFS